jgi:hypothetical protein
MEFLALRNLQIAKICDRPNRAIDVHFTGDLWHLFSPAGE